MVLVFKTSLEKKQEQKVRNILSEFDEINKISFDFDDCDKVLRIESEHDITTEVEVLLRRYDIFCEDLERSVK